MRTVTIPVYASKRLELFFDKRDHDYELWTVGIAKGQRVVIDHCLTHDDLETRLEYSRPEDLVWQEARRLDIPTEKHKLAVEREDSIMRGKFQHGASSIFTSFFFLDRDRKDTAAAKKAILGGWTDGVLSFVMEPNNKLQWSCDDKKHWLNIGAYGPAPDWWTLSGVWELHLMANMGKPKACGTHVGVVHVDERQLHIRGGHLNRIVHVFNRVQAA